MASATPDEKQSATVGPLRVGLLVDSLVQPAWVARALERVVEQGVGEFVLVVRNAARPAPATGSRLAGYWRNRRHLLYAAYQRIDRAYKADPDPFAVQDVSSLLAGVPVVDVVPRQTRNTDVFEDADVARIRDARVDVLVRLGFRILRGDILNAARYGIWSWHHGDNTRYRGGPPCFWEVMEGEPVTGTILQRLTEALDDGEVLYRSWGSTNVNSVLRSSLQPYWKGAEFLARALRDVQLGLPTHEARPPIPYNHRLYVAPSNREMLAGLSRLAGRRLRSKWQSLTSVEQWFLAWRRTPGVPDESHEPDLSPYRFRPIYPPRDRFWADPFLLRANGALYVVFEDLPFDTHRGVISALEMGPQGPVGEARVVLSRDYHLSYPFVFTWRGQQWMIPETADVNRVELYRAVRAPDEWQLESTLMEGAPLADCTLAEIGDRWWMFANSAAPGASFWDELHLFHASSPLGPWTPHRRNPVVSDVRSSRPAGALFRRGDAWYRPSQDSAGGYGSAANIMRILRIDTEEYEEERVGKLLPLWQPGLNGVHTINALGGLTVIDARRRIRR
jgi:hypothetical protein